MNKNILEDLCAKQEAAEDAMVESHEQLSLLQEGTPEYELIQSQYYRLSDAHDEIAKQINQITTG